MIPALLETTGDFIAGWIWPLSEISPLATQKSHSGFGEEVGRVKTMGDEKVPLLEHHLEPETEFGGDGRREYANGYSNGFHNHGEVCVTIENLGWEEEGDDGVEEGEDEDLAQMQKAVDLFSNVPAFGKLPSIDPFINKTPTISGLYAKLRSVLLLPVLVLRLLLVGVILVVGFVATKLALAGWEKGQEVLPRWRRRLMIVTRLCGRGVLFCFG